MIPYCTGHYEIGAAKQMAQELRNSGRCSRVELGSYLKEDGKTYCKIYVERIES